MKLSQPKKNKSWIAYRTSVSLLSLIVGVLVGIIVNLLTDVINIFNLILILFSFLCIYELNKIIEIRNEIDEEYNYRFKYRNMENKNPVHIIYFDLNVWQEALDQKEVKLKETYFWIKINTITIFVIIFIVFALKNQSQEYVSKMIKTSWKILYNLLL